MNLSEIANEINKLKISHHHHHHLINQDYNESLLLSYNNNNLELFIEIVICTDYSIYQLHKTILNDYLLNDSSTNDTQLITNHIKAYYTQIINGVSFKKNFLSLSLSLSLSWPTITNPTYDIYVY